MSECKCPNCDGSIEVVLRLHRKADQLLSEVRVATCPRCNHPFYTYREESTPHRKGGNYFLTHDGIEALLENIKRRRSLEERRDPGWTI
ncbi:MAG: hypothetical protein WDZ79_00200 [Candidatus Paceibacterota bacterium]